MVFDLSELYPLLKNEAWDRQTVVIVCDSWERCMAVRDMIHKRRRPNSQHLISYDRIESDSFVNLNYDPIKDKRPQDRNVRIVYVDGSNTTHQEMNERFEKAYIFYDSSMRGDDADDTNAIGTANSAIDTASTRAIESK